MSLFKDNISIDNPQSREEDEELEEQKRRQEELSDLLKNAIGGFHYDDSTMNSSLTSAEGVEPNFPEMVKNSDRLQYEDSGKTTFENTSANLSEAIERGYKDMNQEEQLKVLYDVKVREISKLRDEFNKFKEEKAQEVKVLKNKATLSEAEARHIQVTLSNSESLLVEKTQIINDLKQTLRSRDEELLSLKKVLEQQNLEICTYQSTVTELQLKLADNNPFSAGTRKLNSEELQKAHQDQIVKLDTLFQEKSKKVQILEKEKYAMETDIKKLIQYKNESEKENNLTIMGLSKKLQSTQEQCKDLFLLGEALKKESDHFKERMQQLETNGLEVSETFQHKNLDKETMMVQLEKLKRMLLDRNVELNTLKAKLKFYNSDLNELFEYREILSKMYSCEVKSCNNNEHEELLIFMQRQLQSYQQAVEDRNNQIISLNIINKELQEKIEEMIQQTRTDIQNISQKYSLPQLETMSKELKNSQETINNLKQQLLEKDDQLQKKIGTFSGENNDLQQLAAKERLHFDEVLSQVKRDLNQRDEEKNELLKEVQEFKKVEIQLTEENERVKTQLQKICLKLGLSEADIFESDGDVHELNSLKLKYGRIHDQLQHVLVHLEIMNVKRTNFNIIFKLKKQIQNYCRLLNEQKLEQGHFQDKLEQWDNMLTDFIESLKHSENYANLDTEGSELKEKIEDLTTAKTLLEGEKCNLECQLNTRTDELEAARRELALFRENVGVLEQENTRAVQKLNDQIHNLKKSLQGIEENKLQLEQQLRNTVKQLNEAKEETVNLRKEVTEAGEKLSTKNLAKELKDVDNIIQQNIEDVSGNDVFQAQVLKVELALRDQLQEESIKKMQKIEDQYKKVIEEKLEMYSKEKEKWKHQEANYRKQFAAVLEECGRKMEDLEKENTDLVKRVNGLHQEYKAFKDSAINNIDRYNKTIIDCRKTMETSNARWATLFESYMTSVAKIEKQHNKTSKSVLKKIAVTETEIKLIENLYDEKIKKLKADKMKKLQT